MVSREELDAAAQAFLDDTDLDWDDLIKELLDCAYENGHGEEVKTHLKRRRDEVEAACDGT